MDPTEDCPGPIWTWGRLQQVMGLRFGLGVRGGPDTAAAAAQMGVSTRTVQRWLRARQGTSLTHIPPARLEQLIALLLPSASTLVKEEQQARYAAEAIAALQRPRGVGIQPAWMRSRWLEDHLVVVIEVPRHLPAVGAGGGDVLHIRQLSVGRVASRAEQDFNRRGRIIDERVLPTRFHASVLRHHVLTELGPFRYQAQPSQAAVGFTQTWLSDAPPTALVRDGYRVEQLAAELLDAGP